MRQSEKKHLAQWLDERRQIWQKYLKQLDAVEDFNGETNSWEVFVRGQNGKLCLLNRHELHDSDAGRSLLINRAYYCGALAALCAAGVYVNIQEEKHRIN